MRFTYENPALQQQIEGARNLEDLDAALQAVAGLVPTFMDPQIRGRQMFCPGLDGAISQLPRRLGLPDMALARGDDNVCIVATRFYPTGGHSKVAADITRLVGAARTSIALTDLYRQLKVGQLVGRQGVFGTLQARAIQIMAAPSLGEKVVELYMALAAIRPSRIFLIQNHMDAVAVAACWPFRNVVEFVHHADHMPTLGATLPWFGHLDLTYTCHLACKEAGLAPTWLGMTVENVGDPPPARATQPGRLRIATCGASHKYQQPARHRWSDFVAAVLGRPGAEFLHIGPHDEALDRSVRDGLTAAGVDPQRYRFLGVKPNLRQALIEEEVDAYMASYPDSGGKAVLEAMAAGIVPIVPVPAELGPLLHFDLPLDTWVRITDPREAEGALERSLELSERLRSAEGQTALKREFRRFEQYLGG